MSPDQEAHFTDKDESAFVIWVRDHLVNGAALKRGITANEYVEICRHEWALCAADEVYRIKMLVDPLMQPELAAESPWSSTGRPYCVLIARVDSNGDLVDAPPEYEPPSGPGVHLLHMVAGSPSGGTVPDPSRPAPYLIGFLDVLGFEALLERIGLEELTSRYEQLLRVALVPHSETRPWSLALAEVRGELTAGLMWLPIQTAYFSDSLLLWVHYHPGHVAEFLHRCARVFCEAMALGLPLRGALSVGEALLDKTRGMYLGRPLIEAVRLEGQSDWVGVALGSSFKSESLHIPVPPDAVLKYRLPLKEKGLSLFSDLVLDWPRVWRDSRTDSAADHLTTLADGLTANVREKYSAALQFWEYSLTNKDWFVPPGWTRITPKNVKYSIEDIKCFIVLYEDSGAPSDKGFFAPDCLQRVLYSDLIDSPFSISNLIQTIERSEVETFAKVPYDGTKVQLTFPITWNPGSLVLSTTAGRKSIYLTRVEATVSHPPAE